MSNRGFTTLSPIIGEPPSLPPALVSPLQVNPKELGVLPFQALAMKNRPRAATRNPSVPPTAAPAPAMPPGERVDDEEKVEEAPPPPPGTTTTGAGERVGVGGTLWVAVGEGIVAVVKEVPTAASVTLEASSPP